MKPFELPQLVKASSVVAELAALFQMNGSLSSEVQTIHGSPAVRRTFNDLRRAATKQIRSYHCPPFQALLPENGEDAVGVEVLERGVRIDILADTALLGEPSGVAHLMGGIAAGWQVRLLNKVPFKMLICDDSVAMISKADESARDLCLVIRPCLILDTILSGFQTLWSLAAPVLPRTCEQELDDSISDTDRRMLLLLASGATDEVIARRLFLSLRTVQRRVQLLTTRLGAATRFQAGVNAAKRGWL
ncbi:helix-turn-helix transcriptional regulator [Lentzea sp. HUAS12]|uniref:helix-turn-helix transcriptional regulator n=1 Tax=Lentzea sp. HUAS12 TaxID=2951806 RepID=UPI00209F7AAC|nr:helix-turn-helix transcriptional regulator [Lentzea sp. HUAS12]USX56288.1 helix-turn-helix transcriptional regulator [Lentzea sp. HUAS12]